MKSWRIVTVLLLCLTLVSVTACNPFGGDEEEISQQLVKVVRGDLTISVSGSGNIVVANEAELHFSSSGKIDKIYVDENDEVSKDDVLARLDTDPLELALAQAQAALEQAEYNLEKAEDPYSREDIKSARAAVESAEDYLDYAEWMLDQAEEDEDAGVDGAEAQVQQWTKEVSRAWAALLAVEATLETILSAPDEDELEILEMQVDVAEQALEEAQKQLDEATLIAPFDGVVVSVDADEGDSVSAMTTIVHLVDLTSIELEVEVDEIDIAEVKPGQKAIIEIDALPALQLEGEVTSISTLSIEMGGLVLYEVTIGFDASLDSGLKLGMSAIADIILEERSNVLLLPNRAIIQDSQGNPIVKVMVDEEIEERPVVTGISDGFDTEIVSGLSEGDVVVIETKTKPPGSGGLFG